MVPARSVAAQTLQKSLRLNDSVLEAALMTSLLPLIAEEDW